MVCHLSDAFRMVIGDKIVSHATSPVQRTIVKWIALYAPVRWPPGILTRPEIEQGVGGTCPGDFAPDVADLVILVDAFTSQDGRVRVAAASNLRPPHREGLASLGIPPHGPSPSPVRRLAAHPPACIRCDTVSQLFNYRTPLNAGFL